MTLTAKSAIVAALVVASTAASSAWPKPYAGQAMHMQDGVLVSFANGNRAGGLTVRTADGKTQDYATTLRMTWLHRTMSCYQMPEPNEPATACASWPKSIVPGKTIVRITYWDAVHTAADGPGVSGPERIVKDVSALR